MWKILKKYTYIESFISLLEQVGIFKPTITAISFIGAAMLGLLSYIINNLPLPLALIFFIACFGIIFIAFESFLNVISQMKKRMGSDQKDAIILKISALTHATKRLSSHYKVSDGDMKAELIGKWQNARDSIELCAESLINTDDIYRQVLDIMGLSGIVYDKVLHLELTRNEVGDMMNSVKKLREMLDNA